LKFAVFGLLSCKKYCVNALEAKQINHTATFYNTSSNVAFRVFGNIPRITSIDPIFPVGDDDGDDDADDGTRRRRRLQEDGQIGVQITYDHTFEFLAQGTDVHIHQIAGLPFASEESRDDFVQSLKEYNIFEDVTGMTRIFFPDITQEPSSEPTIETRPPSSTAGANQSAIAPKGEVYSIGVIIGIAVGGSALLLICIFCVWNAKRRTKETSSYVQQGDELSFGFSTVYTKEQRVFQ